MIGLGRAYAVEFHTCPSRRSRNCFYIKPAADKICVIEAIYRSNVGGAADAGDSQESSTTSN